MCLCLFAYGGIHIYMSVCIYVYIPSKYVNNSKCVYVVVCVCICVCECVCECKCECKFVCMCVCVSDCEYLCMLISCM